MLQFEEVIGYSQFCCYCLKMLLVNPTSVVTVVLLLVTSNFVVAVFRYCLKIYWLILLLLLLFEKVIG